jgi:CPA2 family monovalent cation:H+ antiporter-2
MIDIHGAGGWLLGLAAALGFLAITGGLGLRLRFSTIPGYLLGGVILGAVFDIPETFLHILMTLGSMLILFFVGLEFSPGSLRNRFKGLIKPAFWDAVINIPLAVIAAFALGMPIVAAICFALAAYASSSAIIAKGLMDYKLIVLPEAEWCLGILVVEDLLMAFLLPLCVVMLGAGSLELVGGIAATLLAGLLLLGLFVVLARIGLVSRWLNQPEKDLTLLVSLALVCLIAGIGESSGISAAGALLVGMVVSESDSRKRIEALLVPHRELLAVGFFAAIGAGADWRLLIDNLGVAITLVLVTSLAKILGGYLGGRSQSMSGESAVRLGLLLVPRGEFALVVAALTLGQPWGVSFYNTIVAYVIVSALSGTLLIRYHVGISRRLSLLLP